MEINEKLIINCLKELKSNQHKYSMLKRYYEGQHDILSNYAMQDARSNMKVVVNFCKRFIDERVSYITTNQINYISRSGDSEIINVIDQNIAIWEKLNNQNLLKKAQIYGKSYSLIYLDEDTEFRSLTLTPLNCYVLESERVGQSSHLALRTYFKRFDDTNTEYLDVYTKNEILHYKIITHDKLEYLGKHGHVFGKVPIIICRANDEERSLIEDIKSLNDSYNIILSDLCNEVSDFRACLMAISGAAEISRDEARQMKQTGIIYVPQGATVSYLVKQINDTFVQNLLQELEEKMFKTVSTIDSNEKMQSNTSSVAIQGRQYILSSICGLIQAELESAIRQRLQMFFNFYALKTNKQFSHKDIVIKFTLNLPSDIASLADAASKIKDIVSQKSLLSLFPFIENVDSEVEQFRKEYEEMRDLGCDDLDKIDSV